MNPLHDTEADTEVRTVHRDGLVFIEHEFECPLRHSIVPEQSHPGDDATIKVFVREVALPGPYRDGTYTQRPGLLFLQGGPGGASPRPLGATGWVGTALERGYRVFLLDQRGTGRSTPVTPGLLERIGTPQQQAEYLAWHRADNIVADAEFIRAHLMRDAKTGTVARWSTLGQSYGGFCTLTYLSFAADGLNESLFTGGLAAVTEGADAVYTRTFALMRARNAEFFRQYPHLRDTVTRVLTACATGTVRLPNGETFTPERLTLVGTLLGSGAGLHELAWLFEQPFDTNNTLSTAFLHGVQNHLGYDTAPLYAVLHESIYQDAAQQQPASAWSAYRVRNTLPDFAGVFTADFATPQLLVGESIEPWLFEQDTSLHPYAAVAEILAHKTDWGPLYDLDALRRNAAENQVRCAAAIYHDDIYVPLATSLETAHIIGAKTYITNQLQHDGLRADGELFGTLLQLAQS